MTSVIACAPASTAAADAAAFSVVMTSTASARTSSSAAPRLRAVTIAPTPSGFVSTRTSPARPPAFVTIAPGSTTPVTARPYFGSGSSIECPPTSDAPASATTSRPPRRISRRTSPPSRSSGNATTFIAVTGRPPIA